MESGEKELRKVFEEVTTNNVKATIDHGNETRKIVRQLEEEVKRLSNLVVMQGRILDQYKIQLQNIQTKLYAGGTV